MYKQMKLAMRLHNITAAELRTMYLLTTKRVDETHKGA